MNNPLRRGGVERRRIRDLQNENDKLGSANNIAEEITTSGSSILMSLESQQNTLRNVKSKTS